MVPCHTSVRGTSGLASTRPSSTSPARRAPITLGPGDYDLTSAVSLRPVHRIAPPPPAHPAPAAPGPGDYNLSRSFESDHSHSAAATVRAQKAASRLTARSLVSAPATPDLPVDILNAQGSLRTERRRPMRARSATTTWTYAPPTVAARRTIVPPPENPGPGAYSVLSPKKTAGGGAVAGQRGPQGRVQAWGAGIGEEDNMCIITNRTTQIIPTTSPTTRKDINLPSFVDESSRSLRGSSIFGLPHVITSPRHY